MQHIPVVSHALWRGTLSLVKTVDVVPTAQNNWLIPSTGLKCVYLQREKSLTGPGERQKEASGTEAEAEEGRSQLRTAGLASVALFLW